MPAYMPSNEIADVGVTRAPQNGGAGTGTSRDTLTLKSCWFALAAAERASSSALRLLNSNASRFTRVAISVRAPGSTSAFMVSRPSNASLQ